VKRTLLLFVLAGLLQAQTITILHTNDMHCQYTPTPATWVQKEPRPLIGGMVALESLVRSERDKGVPTLLLDAGDVMTGTPIAKISRNGVLGGAFMDMMNIIGYRAMTIGNHEFDEGQANLGKLIASAHFDVLSANLYQQDHLITGKPYAIYKVGKLRVGVIGLTLSRLFDETAKKNLDGIRVDDPVAAAQKYIDEIDAKTDLVIVLSHQGVDEDLAMASQLHGADIIVGGHSHSRLNKAIQKNHMLVVQADCKTRYLGRLTVTVAADTVSHYSYELLPAWVDDVKKPNQKLQKMVQDYQAQIQKEYGQPIGALQTDWQRNNSAESNIGNYLADVVRAVTSTDFALLNSGGIRKDVHKGGLCKLDIVEILPFTNYITKFQLTGAQLLTLIETNAKAALRQEPGILQISGLSYSFRIDKGGAVKVLSSAINGQPIDPARTYTGASVDFVIYGQAEKYFGFSVTSSESTGLLLSDAVIDYILAHPQVDSRIDGRISVIDERRGQ
jgi:2',3'-cyclic-nucleotide 2'-phosphodiesterase (5'-nucleotidase family)